MGKADFKLPELHVDKNSFVSAMESISNSHYSLSLIDGPFYANGSLHLGHFANKVFKDAYIRTLNLFGENARLLITSDQHGLPIEMEVEKLYGKNENFISNCRQYASSQFKNQLQQVKQFGVLADDRTIQTASFEYEAFEMRKLVELYKSGKLVRMLRPVHFCSQCNSSLAEAEVEYKERKSPSLTVKFKIEDGVYLLVWTTTPYTLFVNKAVAYNAKLEYVKWYDSSKNEYYVTVKPFAENLEVDYSVYELCNKKAVSPINDQTVPLIAADYVESSGTGLVHIAPNFGLDDYRVGINNNLEVVDCIDNKGIFNSHCPELEGKDIKQVSDLALEKLKESGLIYELSTINHNVGHCWRHKSQLFFKASKEWFLNLEEIPQKYQHNETYMFYPENSKNRFEAMINSRKLWCVSRNRKWGVPLPFYYDENDNVVDSDELWQKAIEAVELNGVEAWYTQKVPYKLSEQVADVWFDSGILTAYVKEKIGINNNLSLLLVEGSDQHRGWFNSTVCSNLLLGNYYTPLNIFTHGFVVDEKGAKLSKSNKNYVELSDLFKQHSPDVLRYMVLSQNVHQDIVFSQDVLKQANEKYKKIRNTFRFVLQNLDGYKADEINSHYGLNSLISEFSLSHSLIVDGLNCNSLTMLAINKKLHKLMESISSNVANYDFSAITRELYDFSNEISVLFDAFKDSLYCDGKYSKRRLSICKFLKSVADIYAYAVSIIMPFTAEEYWKTVGNKGLVSEYDVDLEEWEASVEKHFNSFAYDSVRNAINAEFLKVKTDEFKSLSMFELLIDYSYENDLVLDDGVGIKLATVFGVADVTFVKNPNNFTLKPYNGKKCNRCWNYHNDSQNLCSRCFKVESEIKGH